MKKKNKKKKKLVESEQVNWRFFLVFIMSKRNRERNGRERE